MKYLAFLFLLFIIESCIKKAYGPDDHVKPEEIISITTSPSSLEADGYSVDTVRISIPEKSDSTRRKIMLTTTVGTFLGSTSSPQIMADINGQAIALLQAPNSPGTALVSATIGPYTATGKVVFTDVKPANKVQILAFPAILPADGTSISSVTVVVSTLIPSNAQAITVSTTAGQLIGNNSNLKPNLDGKLVIQLIAPNTPGTAYISAETNLYKQTIPVSFTTAFAERITIDPGTFVIPAAIDEQVTVSATLMRTIGKPSQGAVVRFQAYDSTGTNTLNQGQFRSITLSDQNGSATALFSPGATPYRGRSIIRAFTSSATGADITGQTSILIIDPAKK